MPSHRLGPRAGERVQGRRGERGSQGTRGAGGRGAAVSKHRCQHMPLHWKGVPRFSVPGESQEGGREGSGAVRSLEPARPAAHSSCLHAAGSSSPAPGARGGGQGDGARTRLQASMLRVRRVTCSSSPGHVVGHAGCVVCQHLQHEPQVQPPLPRSGAWGAQGQCKARGEAGSGADCKVPAAALAQGQGAKVGRGSSQACPLRTLGCCVGVLSLWGPHPGGLSRPSTPQT